MPSVEIKHRKLQVGKTSLPLLSGEFHYFRNDPMYWGKILDSIEALGLNFIGTYICWDFHQIGKNKFDFTGQTNPRRNLKSFLALTQKRGFKLFIRPGPYIYSEWKNLGLPDEAAKHPRYSKPFLKRAQNYMRSVCQVIKPYLATNGGHIVFFQADNEIDLMAGGFETALGLTGKKGPFQKFLKQKYHNIEKLNNVWESDYSSFDSVKAVTSWKQSNLAYWRRYYDYRLFAIEYSNQKAAWMVETYRKMGIDVPIVLNTYSEYEVQDFPALERLADLTGVDVYPENELSGGRDSHQFFLERLRLLPAYSKAPYIVEFESGLWHGFIHRVKNLTPNHYQLIGLTALLAGIVGWNWYMLVNRDNWYQAPITELGDFRVDLEPVFKQMVTLYQQLRPADNERLCSVGVTFSFAHYRMGKGHEQDEVLKTLYEAGIDYTFELTESLNNKPEILFYSGEEWLPKEEHQKLKEYVYGGGTLVCFKKAPLYDEMRGEWNALDLPLPEGVIGGREVMSHKKNLRLKWARDYQASLFSEVFLYDPEQGKPILAYQEKVDAWEAQWKQVEGEQYCVGLELKRGKGSVILLGVDPNPQLLKTLLTFYQINLPVQSMHPHVQSALFRRQKGSKKYFLILTHNGTDATDVHLTLPYIKRLKKLKSLSGYPAGAVSGKETQCWVHLPPKSGDILQFEA